ncbi:MAG: ABC transporter ATP-binding protein [Bacillota bacterium]
MVDVQNLVKEYGPVRAVDNISLSIEKGDIYGLLGPNGAGKSTTISVISTLLKPTSGNVYVSGFSVTENPDKVRKLIGLVPQDIALYPTLTAQENLSFFGSLHGLKGKNLRLRMDEVFDIVGLKNHQKNKVETFSGGMKRRLNIGVGLLNQPELLILDEPTVGIDPQSRNHILETIKELNRQGMTVLYTSHYMEEVDLLCNRIGIIDHGKLIAQGTKAEIKGLIGNKEKLNITVSNLGKDQLNQLKSLIDHHQLIYYDGLLTILGSEVGNLLSQIVLILNDGNAHIHRIDIQEPNLESVFLHLTGRALRE